MKATDFKEVSYTFQLTRTSVFFVKYYRLGDNENQNLSLSAAVFNRPKSDYNQCGQCQGKVCEGLAKKFVSKWNSKHLGTLIESEYNDIISDIENMKNRYNWCEGNGFYSAKKLSMQKIKA